VDDYDNKLLLSSLLFMGCMLYLTPYIKKM